MSRAKVAIPFLLLIAICGCSSQKSAERERYRLLHAMENDPTTRFVDLRAYAKRVEMETSDPDIRTVAEYVRVASDIALVANYGNVGQAENASGWEGFIRSVTAMLTEQDGEYLQAMKDYAAINEEEVAAARVRLRSRY